MLYNFFFQFFSLLIFYFESQSIVLRYHLDWEVIKFQFSLIILLEIKIKVVDHVALTYGWVEWIQMDSFELSPLPCTGTESCQVFILGKTSNQYNIAQIENNVILHFTFVAPGKYLTVIWSSQGLLYSNLKPCKTLLIMKNPLLIFNRNQFIEIFLVENERSLGIWLSGEDLVLIIEDHSWYGRVKRRIHQKKYK